MAKRNKWFGGTIADEAETLPLKLEPETRPEPVAARPSASGLARARVAEEPPVVDPRCQFCGGVLVVTHSERFAAILPMPDRTVQIGRRRYRCTGTCKRQSIRKWCVEAAAQEK